MREEESKWKWWQEKEKISTSLKKNCTKNLIKNITSIYNRWKCKNNYSNKRAVWISMIRETLYLKKKEERKNLDFNKKKLERPKFDSWKDDKIKEWNVKKEWKTEKGM